jgi:predicted alpha/beta-hydrolase family hydrolase
MKEEGGLESEKQRDALFLFAHGAGAPSSHSWMRRWAGLLKTIGQVRTFDYPYLAGGRKRPDPLPKLIEAHRAALDDARQSHRGPIVLIGKSMGGRVGCHLALQEAVPAIVCLGYPLCGGGDCAKLRDKVLRELSTPILFVQGTRDSLCPLDVLARVRAEMHAANELHVVDGGDHSLIVTKGQLKASGETQDGVDQRILQVIRRFVENHTGADR